MNRGGLRKAVSYGPRPRARVGQNSRPCAFFLHFHLLMRPYAHVGAVLPGRFAPRFPIFNAQGGCYTWAFPSQRVATRLKISPLTRLFSVSIVCPPAPILLKAAEFSSHLVNKFTTICVATAILCLVVVIVMPMLAACLVHLRHL